MPAAESISQNTVVGSQVLQKERKSHAVRAAYRALTEVRQIAEQSLIDASKPIVNCHVCNAEFKQIRKNHKYCSDACKNKARKLTEEYKEKSKAWQAAWYKKNIDKARSDAVARYSKIKLDNKSYRREIELKKQWRQQNQEAVAKHRAKQRLRRLKFDAHVKAWLTYQRKLQEKYCAHVAAFVAFKRTASDGWHARHWKAVGKPWNNPRLSDALQYKIQYRLDLEFRLSEINRLGWRKETLAARDDGTANFWEMLRERKTCPYCGTRITKENAVADHMDPLKLGGSNSQHNLTICCRDCNQKKAAKPFSQWLEMLPQSRRRAARLWYIRKHSKPPEDPRLTFTFTFTG